ncbi:MAG: ATP-binding cassette domain-containing protein [Dysgonomonas mossii]|uniref:ABC transporter ATP-binding protein n=1 Tax=Dysgonomonas mossii TaxID=163665 RepID=UPI001D9BF8B5|nr:ATP-binding cassette domain-containing protein [Dysgonomonas mossii]MBS5796097.1 ATP-binding cassette domain-containing protein [Dysgonomonas mossii]MBS7110983.1 ATP-binding cassette domain-containing protein [Dysgonomonas mossii]
MYYLEAHDVVKQYGSHRALDGVSVQVPKGCIYGLLGPNGAGKSSLIRIINRITAPDEGQVFINGRVSVADDVFNIGYLPEERGLYKKMKVGEHIIFLAQLRGLSKEDAVQKTQYWLKKFDILSWQGKKVEELSKGMQQKIQFIATVIHEPDLYILDEPFSGFDPVNTELLKKELLDLKAKGKTIILSTHNMESVEELCDEISLINKSRVVLNGNVKEIRARYRKHIFKLQVVSETFDLESSHFSILSQSTDSNITELLIQRNDEASNSELIQEIAKRYEVVTFEEVLPSMNDIFIQIVSETKQ